MRTLLRTSAVAVAALVAGATAASAADARTGVTHSPLRLECRQLGTADVADHAAVGCAWSQFTSDGFRAYRLWRSDDVTGRTVVFESRDVSDTHAVDRPLRPGRYAYKIQVTGRTGRVIGVSRVEVVVVVPDPSGPIVSTPLPTGARIDPLSSPVTVPDGVDGPRVDTPTDADVSDRAVDPTATAPRRSDGGARPAPAGRAH